MSINILSSELKKLHKIRTVKKITNAYELNTSLYELNTRNAYERNTRWLELKSRWMLDSNYQFLKLDLQS